MHRSSLVPAVALRAFACGLAVAAWGASAAAHGLDANRLQVVVHERIAEVVATPPSEFVAALADANRDGLLTVDEVRAHREEILRALVAALQVTDGEGRPGELDRSDVSVPRGDDDGARGSDFLRLTVVLRWPGPPSSIRVRCGFITQHPVTVYATRAESLSAPGILTLLGDGEYSTLATPLAEATVLRSSTARPAPPVAAPPAPPAPAARALTRTDAALVLLSLMALAGALIRRRRPSP